MRVVAISIVLAILGVLYILANPNDSGMRGFGWFLVVVGAVIASVFSYLWYRKQVGEPSEKDKEPQKQAGKRAGKRSRDQRRRR